MLCELNRHERDEFITFEEERHLYFIKGKQVGTSVTTLLHKYFTFDADKVSVQISRKQKNNKESEYYGLTPEGVRNKWKQGAQLGTIMHAQIEDYYNLGKFPDEETIEMTYFKNYLKDFPDLKGFRTEWIVYDEEYDIAGSIDMVYKNDDGTLSIYDWKRTKGIKKDNFMGESALPPLHSFPNANYFQYSLQLNVYKWILEKRYGYTIRDMCLVVLHNSNPNYQLEPVDDLQDYVELIMKMHKNSKLI